MKFMIGTEKFHAESIEAASKMANKIMLNRGWDEMRLMQYDEVGGKWEMRATVFIPEVQKEQHEKHIKHLENIKNYREVILNRIKDKKERLAADLSQAANDVTGLSSNFLLSISKHTSLEAVEIARLEGELHVLDDLLGDKK
jgi:hypothetical protein